MSEVTESELAERCPAPRITLEALEANIKSKEFFLSGLMTICVLTLRNGFSVVGEAGCADPSNFNKDIGERLAFENAKNKIWSLMGYELKTKIVLAAEADPPTKPEMQTYVGTKVVHALPMNRRDYNFMRGWTLPVDENGDDEGYLVEYPDSDSQLDNWNGYISWSPKNVFERAYVGGFNTNQETQVLRTTWYARVIMERDEISERFEKLSEFMASSRFGQLSPTHRTLLQDQSRIMIEYIRVLNDRLEAN